MAEGQLEVAVAVAAALVADAVAGVVGAGHEAAVAEEGPVARRSARCRRLRGGSRRRTPCRCRGCEAGAARRRRARGAGAERALQALDLAWSELGLLDVASAWSCPNASRSATSRTLCFSSSRAMEFCAATRRSTSWRRVRSTSRSGPQLVGDHVRFGQEIGPEKMGQHGRIGAVGLDFGGGDGLDALGVGEVEVDACRRARP